MIIEIIKHTPTWVFVLFIALVYIGYTDTKDKEVELQKVYITPIVVILLSVSSILSISGITSIALWFLSGSITLFLGLKLLSAKNIEFNSLKKTFYVPGSWLPMFLILGIFSIKYVSSVVVGHKFYNLNPTEFITIISLLYGVINGMFISRNLVILRSRSSQ